VPTRLPFFDVFAPCNALIIKQNFKKSEKPPQLFFQTLAPLFGYLYLCSAFGKAPAGAGESG
jgi:hypothetical protein